jgi:hypothetical protein
MQRAIGGAWIVFGLFLATGKFKLVIVYRDEENHHLGRKRTTNPYPTT